MLVGLSVLCGIAGRVKGMYIFSRRGNAAAVFTHARYKGRWHRAASTILFGCLSRNENYALGRRTRVENPADDISIAAVETNV